MDDKIILTPEGLQELEDELNERINVTRVTIANDIENARQQGDLSENAAYKAAMEQKEFNEIRIQDLQRMIQNAVVQTVKKNNNSIDLGEEFILLRTADDKRIKYKLVGGNEADPAEGKISIDSPIGKAVHKKKYGEVVSIDLPSGKVEFRIEQI